MIMLAASFAILLGARASSSSYPGFEALEAADQWQCTADGDICIYQDAEPGVLTIAAGDREVFHWSPTVDGDDLTVEPMPALIRLDRGRLLVGALVTRRTSYSGGGGSATDRVLALVEPGKPVKPVLTLPESGALSLRACFTESQYKRRAGACSAEFRFTGTLAAVTSTATAFPALRFRLEASHFPRGASRYDDADTRSPIRRTDLKWEKDPRCTFERSFRFDAALEKYSPDTPLPDCSDYTQP